MRRVRVCPICSGQFDVTVANCPNDRTDLLLIPPILVPEYQSPPVRKPVEEGTVRAPRAAAPANGKVVLSLELVENPAVKFEIAEGQTVGRTEKADVVLAEVPNGKYISSRMAQFLRRGDQWFVQHIASTNYIEVDGERYEDDTEVALYDGSVLNLALCPFIVRIGTP